MLAEKCNGMFEKQDWCRREFLIRGSADLIFLAVLDVFRVARA